MAASGWRATWTPSRASTTVAASGLVFRLLTRRSTGARACIAASTGSKSRPSEARELVVQEVGKVEPHRDRARPRGRAPAPPARPSVGGAGSKPSPVKSAARSAPRRPVGEQDRAAGLGAAEPAERAAPAQPVEDEVAHGGAVLGAGEAARARPARQRPLGRLAGEDGVEKLDRGGQAGTGGHGRACARKPRPVQAPEPSAPRRWSTGQRTPGVDNARRLPALDSSPCSPRCNTDGSGVGQDVQQGGAAVTDTAREPRRNVTPATAGWTRRRRDGTPRTSAGRHGGSRRAQAATRPPSTWSTCCCAVTSSTPLTAATSRVRRSSAAS